MFNFNFIFYFLNKRIIHKWQTKILQVQMMTFTFRDKFPCAGSTRNMCRTSMAILRQLRLARRSGGCLMLWVGAGAGSFEYILQSVKSHYGHNHRCLLQLLYYLPYVCFFGIFTNFPSFILMHEFHVL